MIFISDDVRLTVGRRVLLLVQELLALRCLWGSFCSIYLEFSTVEVGIWEWIS